ncbi:homoserine kinase [Psychroserpens damuponensis]|uniref:homoserine kinase n=1 Tax=Psychroserpens damuponensis TaxID=943936 RepID=UPI00059040C8|nr:homoserine kinase [Psychroserpens damuponensis]
MNEIKIFSPATVANVSCGFDVLGFCLDTIGDDMVIRKTNKKGIHITKIEGYDLPFEAKKNVAGVSALAMLEDAKPDFGFEIEIYKNIKPGSGVGSSSASAVGSVFGMNELLGRPYNKTQLTNFAMKGEALASQCEHADNIAPAIFGGFTLVKSVAPLDILQLPTPNDLFAVIIHPQIEIKTSDARAILPKKIDLKDAITQWSNVGSLVHALHTNDYKLLSNSLTDVVVEPFRSQLIPYFEDVKKSALDHGALGCGISGSGPSIFSLCYGNDTTQKVAKAIKNIYAETGISYEIYVSKINTEGIKILNTHQ